MNGAQRSECFNPVAGIHCNESTGNFEQEVHSVFYVSIPLPGFIVMKGFLFMGGWSHSHVSIPLPGFIVMKDMQRKQQALTQAIRSFNPVAGIHCNERLKQSLLDAIGTEFQSRCRDSL